MDWNKELYGENEKPLDRLADGYSYTSIFRKIAFIGDSLSSGEFETRDENGNAGYHDLFEYSWGQYIARKNGLTAYNFSRGGMTASEYIKSFAEDRGFWDENKACQAYVIALGVNDILNCNMPVGSTDDIDPDDYRNNKDTFIGNYAHIVSRYKEISPDAKFFFVTVPREPSRDDTRKERALKLNNAIKSMVEYFDNAYLIDLYTYGPAYDVKFRENFFLYGHMSPTGYIFTARMIDSYIDYIIRHTPNDFKNAGFITTNIRYE